jgi:selenide,water dikinase
MGGRPVSALSLVGFPEKGDPAILEQIIRGGLDKMAEAKCSVIGGHSIRNEDIQFGYAVTGLVDPKRVWRNVGAQADDVLLLTKPIGTGVLSTALKNDRLQKPALDAAVASMTRLNRAAVEVLRTFETTSETRSIHAVTDITGFGLLGHAREMALGDPAAGVQPVSLEFQFAAVPLLPDALEAVREGMIPGGLKNNREFLGDCVGFAPNVPEENRALLYDPQTSGGLLVAIAADYAENAIAALQVHGVLAERVGRVRSKTSPLISVI